MDIKNLTASQSVNGLINIGSKSGIFAVSNLVFSGNIKCKGDFSLIADEIKTSISIISLSVQNLTVSALKYTGLMKSITTAPLLKLVTYEYVQIRIRESVTIFASTINGPNAIFWDALIIKDTTVTCMDY